MQSKFEIVNCSHGKPCYIKTGLKNPASYLKSFYICSLASDRCKFSKKTDLEAIRCPAHPGNYIELYKPFVDDVTKEKKFSYRCSMNNLTKKWCGNMLVGISPVDIDHKINEESHYIGISENKDNNNEQLSSNLFEKKYSVSELEKNIAAQKNLLVTINPKKLPDGGNKIKIAVEQMSKTLEMLKLEIKEHEIASGKNANFSKTNEAAKLEDDGAVQECRQSERNTKCIEPPYIKLQAQNTNFDSKPKRDVIKQTEGGISKAIKSLHMQLESCPAATDEVEGPSCLNVDLMTHQKQALAWLTWREIQIPRGGILADDMGLGKTLTMISLILKQKEFNDSTVSKWFEKPKTSISSNSTLVVCPASLIHQWKSEIDKRVASGSLTVFLYQGPSRKENINKLLESDVVIASYNIISTEVGVDKPNNSDKHGEKVKNEASDHCNSPLLRIQWHRIILDEGHTIKNHRSVTALSVCRLKANVRWVLSGTPIHNDLSDVYSLLRFLQCSPFDDYSLWKRQVDNKSKYGEERLNTIIKVLMLRRTKVQKCSITGSSLVSLPQRKYEIHTISLSDEERKIYDAIFAKSKAKMQEYLNVHDQKGIGEFSKTNNATQILLMLLRLRQSCCHPHLMREVVAVEDIKVADLEIDLADQLSAMSLTAETCHDAEPISASLYDIDAISTKIKFLIEIMSNVRDDSKSLGTTTKSVVVSQWTKMLSIVHHHLTEANFRCCTISGDIPALKRSEIIDEFNSNPQGPEVMLLSLRAGGTGLNLTGGNHLYITDMHWNPALESQACDRIYRVGQKKDVFIHKFVCKDTIEEKILNLQQRKVDLASNILMGVGGPASKLSLRDLRVLFGIESRFVN